ncbi:MAG TPA: phosphate acyltransferase [Acetobacteraceae bacterium]|nr:phosphate acyltransferase [Acetobacteraceae bacterium]
MAQRRGVALLSHATFGESLHAANAPMRDAVAILDRRKVDFEYDGEMSLDVALEPSFKRRHTAVHEQPRYGGSIRRELQSRRSGFGQYLLEVDLLLTAAAPGSVGARRDEKLRLGDL